MLERKDGKAVIPVETDPANWFNTLRKGMERVKKTLSALLAVLVLCGSFAACGNQKSIKAEAENYLACLGKSREEVMAGMKLSEQDLSPGSVESVDVFEKAVRFYEQDFALLLYYDQYGADGEKLEAPPLTAVEFVYTTENPGKPDYELANRLYTELRETYGAPDPLIVKDSNEHFQLMDELKELRKLISGSKCCDTWSEIGHKGMQATLSADLLSNKNSVPDAKDSEGTSYRLSVLFRHRPVIR